MAFCFHTHTNNNNNNNNNNHVPRRPPAPPPAPPAPPSPAARKAPERPIRLICLSSSGSVAVSHKAGNIRRPRSRRCLKKRTSRGESIRTHIRQHSRENDDHKEHEKHHETHRALEHAPHIVGLTLLEVLRQLLGTNYERVRQLALVAHLHGAHFSLVSGADIEANLPIAGPIYKDKRLRTNDSRHLNREREKGRRADAGGLTGWKTNSGS